MYGSICLKSLLIFFALVFFSSLTRAQTTQSPEQDRLLPLEITVNSTQGGNWVLLERNGELYAPAEAFDEWRINRRPETPGVLYRGQRWYPLHSVPGFKAQFDFSSL